MKASELVRYKDRYIDLIAQQHKDYKTINKKTGKPMKIYKMEWMIPVWKRGLEMVTSEIIKRENEASK